MTAETLPLQYPASCARCHSPILENSLHEIRVVSEYDHTLPGYKARRIEIAICSVHSELFNSASVPYSPLNPPPALPHPVPWHMITGKPECTHYYHEAT